VLTRAARAGGFTDRDCCDSCTGYDVGKRDNPHFRGTPVPRISHAALLILFPAPTLSFS
jgi:hypothetical protein